MGVGGVLVFQEVSTMKSLHWRCEMWFDCAEQKRLAKLPASATAPRAFAAAPSFQACLRAFVCTFCMCLLCMCVCVRTCIYVYICMCVVYMYMYAVIHMCMCMCMHICTKIVGLSISAPACGQWHICACVFVRICMRMHMCVGIYICAFFCSECCMHFTGVLGTSAWVGVYVTQVCFYTNVHICERTRCRLGTYVYMYICVYMHAYAYGCVCASMILLDALRRCY